MKLLLKEYVAPTQANIILFFLGPVITLIFGLLGFAVLPYGPGLSINDMDLGIFYILAVSSLSTYGILLAGCQNLLHYSFPNKTYYNLAKLRPPKEVELAIYSGCLRTVPHNNNYIGTPALIRDARPVTFCPLFAFVACGIKVG